MEIHNRARGFQPWPGCYTRFRDTALHIWRTRPAERALPGVPGSLHPAKSRLFVTCGGETSLELIELQLEGRKKMSAAAFLNGQHVSDNEVLGEIGN